ncbi:MAG: hypothetical protein UW41_C0029G0013 [Candidatus Collierbacteria bacterium GW2011_GWC2_44_18]|uniref:Uncharacterized protein n=1 Tax=Candidatus Collierbacteria bacterium GW2011_GWC2_44_18 TaxID=1618392 RepID=A0A0G1HML4_9BACT|nr:MAG: hypothetical protein UW16_C0018G0014 [Microgenomates group bacterium GW2011_GWC1_44_10]KKT48446.1 MAG: hypothetical protein UW41_C0029G0013 [Candidatus Collierbacteria bacterium GW2011_GWC2_44_18]
MPWFHSGKNRHGVWSPDGFTERFKEEVRSIRTRFGTKKVRAGLDDSGPWTPCNLRGVDVFVRVLEYDWGCIREDDEYTPVFDITFEIATDRTANPILVKLFKKPAQYRRVFYKSQIRLTFPNYYPRHPPTVYNLMPEVKALHASERHNVLGGGRLCIFSSAYDWNSNKDNACSALLVGLEWCVKHYENFDW